MAERKRVEEMIDALRGAVAELRNAGMLDQFDGSQAEKFFDAAEAVESCADTLEIRILPGAGE